GERLGAHLGLNHSAPRGLNFPSINVIQRVFPIVQLVNVATILDPLRLGGVVVPAAGPLRRFFRGIELPTRRIGYLPTRFGSLARRACYEMGESARRDPHAGSDEHRGSQTFQRERRIAADRPAAAPS